MFILLLNIALVLFDLFMLFATGHLLWLIPLAVAVYATWFSYQSWERRRLL